MVDLDALTHAGWERYCYTACGMLILYEYFLQLDSEVEFFWKQRWSLAKCLFLWNRYYGLGYNIANAVVFVFPHPSLDVSVHSLTELCLRIYLAFKGLKFFHWQNTGASLQVITIHIMLELRLYAMYGSTRLMMCFFLGLTGLEALAMGLLFGLPNPKLIGTNEPSPGVFICADADPLDGSHWVVYFWVSIIIVEGTLLSLALRKAWLHRASVGGSRLMQELTRDSVIYFMTIFGIYIANLVRWMINTVTLDELLTAFSFVVSGIFANRLLISVRQTHYKKQMEAEASYVASLRFARPYTNPYTGTRVTVEVGTFNETAGV